MTRQRTAILAVFESNDRPLSPEEILACAALEVPGINLATVYRNLRSMTEAGQLTVVEMVGRSPRYEVAGLAHHHHFLCEACDRLYDLPKCPSGLLEGLVPPGFELSSHELQLRGRCPSCA